MPSFSEPDADVPFPAVATPGVMISNAWPAARDNEGETERAIATVLERHPFFEAFQTVDVPSAAERPRVKSLLQGRSLTYFVTRLMMDHRANLSSLDESERRRAVDLARTSVGQAAECGARRFGIVAGARPAEADRRREALVAFAQSLAEIAPAASAAGVDMLVEPLDCEAHKRNTLGLTPEAVSICGRLRAGGAPVGICFDTSHVILNGEDVISAFDAARPLVTEFHLCNPVTDRSSPQHGDWHVPLGPPGVIGLDEAALLMRQLWDLGYLSPTGRPPFFIEVMKPGDLDSLGTVAYCETMLRTAWSRSRRGTR